MKINSYTVRGQGI